MPIDRTGTAPRRQSHNLLLAAIAAIGLSGCAGAHFYDAENDKTAAAAKTASDDLDLVGVIDQERGNLSKLLQSDVALVASLSQTLRDGELQALLEDSTAKPLSTRLADAIRRRANELTGADLPTPGTKVDAKASLCGETDGGRTVPTVLLNAVNAERCAATVVESERHGFSQVMKVPAPVCDPAGAPLVLDRKKYTQLAIDAWGPDAGVTEQRLDRRLGDLEKKCTLQQRAFGWIVGHGSIGTRAKDWRKEQTTLATKLTAAKTAKSAYGAALKEYEAARDDAGRNPSENAKKKLGESIEKVRMALKGLGEANVFGKTEAIDEQVAKIDLILKAAATGTVDAATTEKADKDMRAALILAGALPGVVGRLGTVAALADAPPVNALILEKNRLLALKLGADRAVERSKARVDLYERRYEATVAELRTLTAAHQQLVWATAAKGGPISAGDLLNAGPATEKARRLMVAAVATYLTTVSGPQRIAREVDYRLIDVTHAEALDKSETSLRLWQTSIQQPVTALAAYHQSGVRTEDVIEILKGLGLFAIAGRVN